MHNAGIDKSPVIMHGHTGEVKSVQFSADGRIVISGSIDNTIRV